MDISTQATGKYGFCDLAFAASFEATSSLETGSVQYRYTEYRDAPVHHQNIARLWVLGRSVEQIAALYRTVFKDPVASVRKVLRHPPVSTHVAQQMELLREAREAKMRERIDAGDLGFDVVRKMVKDPKTSAKVRGDLAIWLAEKDPLSRFTDRHDDRKDEVQDTESLAEFLDHHEHLKGKEKAAIDVDARSCDTVANKEPAHAAD